MSNVKKTIWGRDFELKVDYDCFEGEEILPSQKAALDSFLAHWDVVDDSLSEVKGQCAKDSNGELSSSSIENIFKYVIPRSLFVVRSPVGTTALMCDYRLDVEHGLAVVFKDGKLYKLGPQDIVL